MGELPSPTLSMGIFFIITTIYFFMQYLWDNTPSRDMIFFVIYILLIILSSYFLNLHMTTILCGTAQIKTTMLVTFFPWLIIFGLLQVALLYYPGWLIPFSNTFGYGIAKLAGLSRKFSAVVKLPSDAREGSSIRKVLDSIYNDKSLLINEIPNANVGFDRWWDESQAGGLIKSNVNAEDKLALRHLIKLKNIISKYIWFTLTGLLTLSASYNFIVKSSCNQSVQEMENNHNEYEKYLEEDAKNKPEKTVYTSYE